MKRKNGVAYFECGPIPVYFGVCLSQAAYDREMKRLKAYRGDRFVSQGAHATTCVVKRARHNDTTILICLDLEAIADRPLGQVAGLLAHEAVHCAESVFEHMGEDRPGSETKAYLVQWFTDIALSEWLRVQPGEKGSA